MVKEFCDYLITTNVSEVDIAVLNNARG